MRNFIAYIFAELEVFFMRDIKKVLEYRAQNKGQRFIAQCLKMSRNTVSNIFSMANAKNLYWSQAKDMSEQQINDYLFGVEGVDLLYVQPDFEWVHKELLKSGVNLQILWEYVHQCEKESKPAYQRSNFYRLYSDYVKKHNLTMHISHTMDAGPY